MTASFDPSLPTPLDRMRDALGDIDVEAPLAPDETYMTRLNDAGGSWRLAAAAMARSFASRAISEPSSFTATGDMSVSWNNQAATWLKIAQALEADAARENQAEGGFWSASMERSDLATDTGEYSVHLRRR